MVQEILKRAETEEEGLCLSVLGGEVTGQRGMCDHGGRLLDLQGLFQNHH